MQKITDKANQIRDVINYVKIFKNAIAVIHIDDSIIGSPLLPSHIHDISLIHEAGIKVIIVPGARRQITQILDEQKIAWQIKDGFRISDARAMPAIKTAALDVANEIMNLLAGEHLTAVIGNWVKARGKGVIKGTDFGSAGEIDKIKTEAIMQTLANGFVPIFPCIGWNDVGKPYNISSAGLAAQIAMHLKADKLFYLLPETKISREEFLLPDETNLSEEGNISAMSLIELSQIIRLNPPQKENRPKNNAPTSTANAATEQEAPSISEASTTARPKTNKQKLMRLFEIAQTACENGVSRIHFLDSDEEGIIPCEIFSAIGSGTMIFNSGYGTFRAMSDEDISAVLSLMNPFIKSGILLPRTFTTIKEQLKNYTVYNVDGGIHACAALKHYDDGQAEIYSVAVDEAYANIGIGPKLVGHLLDKAKKGGAKSVFILTTQSADWFEKLGFTPDTIDTLPPERKALWTPQRASRPYRLVL